MSDIGESFKSTIKKGWKIPSTIILFVITIGGLVQSGESANKYFPGITKWLTANLTVTLTVTVIALSFALVILFWYCGALQRNQKIIENNNQVNKIVLFLSPSSGGGGNFYQEHFSHLVKSAAMAASPRLNIHITLICPPKDFGNEDPELLLDVASNYPANLAGIFMIPAHPDKEINLKAIFRFKEKFPAFVLLDVFPLNAQDISLKSLNFIGGDENEGGKLAALLAKRWLIKCNKKDLARVLILKGRSTLWEVQRVDSFKEALIQSSENHELNLAMYFEESKDLDYELKKACKEIDARINSGQDLTNFDLIFACNDEMAIGALEAMQNLISTKRANPKNLPKIIGYDGTPEMKRLIKSNNPFLL